MVTTALAPVRAVAARARQAVALLGPRVRRSLSWLAEHRLESALVLGGGIALGWHAWRYYPFMADDAFMSLRYSQRLLDGDGLTWSDGVRTEGYSNLLWVLLCALLGACGLDLVTAARLLGMACAASTMLAVVMVALRTTPTPRALGQDARVGAALVGVGILATSATVAVWSIGGLEQPLLGCLIAWAYVALLPVFDDPSQPLSVRRCFVAGACLGGACWTRPDAPLFVAMLTGGVLATDLLRPRAWRRALLVASVPAAFILVQVLFRQLYYGDWVPNTAHAKLALTENRLKEGLEYVANGAQASWPVLLLASSLVLAVLFRPRLARHLVVLLLMAGTWMAYIAVIGGDIFPARRHFYPTVTLLALASAEGLRELFGRYALRSWTLASAFVLLSVELTLQLDDFTSVWAIRERWEWSGRPVGTFLKRHFGAHRPLLAVESAGALPFFAEGPALDMLGLNDRYLATHPPKNFGRGYLAHELGDGRYVLSRRPDLVMFRLPFGTERPEFTSGRQMFADPRFQREYVLVRFEVPGSDPTTVHTWVRYDQAPGLRQGSPTVIPGYLCAASSGLLAREDGDGRLGTVFQPDSSCALRPVELGAGSWRLSMRQSGYPLVVTAGCEGAAASQTGSEVKIELASSCPVTLWVEAAPAGLSHLREIVIARE